MIPIKSLLSVFFIVVFFTSCLPKRREFVCYLPEIETYMCIAKMRGGTCYITISDNQETLSKINDRIDYIKVRNMDDDIFIVYDTINKKDLYVCCGLIGVSQNVKYNIKLYHPSTWKSFDTTFYKASSQYKKLKDEYFYVRIELSEFRVYHNDKVIKEGNLFGN